MPRPYVEEQGREANSYALTKWVKLADLPKGIHPVVKTLEKMKSYDNQAPKLVVYLELLIDGESAMVTGNSKLKKMIEGSHVTSLSEGWVLEAKGFIGEGSYKTRDVDLRLAETSTDLQAIEDEIPF
jgi:hypothetical protein